MKALPSSEWHHRFLQQARWTSELRQFIIKQCGLSPNQPLLEVGCGTGAILSEFSTWKGSLVAGLDLRLDFLQEAQKHFSKSLIQGNAYALPIKSGSFAAVFCHFLFLWLHDPLPVLKEMVRVAKPGGYIIAFAEPDYGGRIDHPQPLVELGRLQGDALRTQGADPCIGRKLSGLFHQVGLVDVQTGILGGQWGGPPSAEAWDSEWTTLENDLAGVVSSEELYGLRLLDEAAWEKGERILFVPTFYAWGKVQA